MSFIISAGAHYLEINLLLEECGKYSLRDLLGENVSQFLSLPLLTTISELLLSRQLPELGIYRIDFILLVLVS